MNKPTWSERIRYWFDNTMSGGTIPLVGWLALLSVVIILVSSLVVWLIGIGTQNDLYEQIWTFVMLMLEPDAITFEHWAYRIATLVIVFTSIFVLSSLIGILTTGFNRKLEQLRKGRSKVIESDHTVILGWSPQIFSIISQLEIANENETDPCIVILANQDKVEMEDAIGDTGKVRVVCRRGDPMRMEDLEIASLNTSKSIILLSPQDENPDAAVIKILLAITKSPARRDHPYHLVAEIHDPKNLEVANIIAGEEARLVHTTDFIARIAAQACRQSGLSIVYQELLDFAGDEIYFQRENILTGKTYREVLFMYEDSAIMGLNPVDRKPVVNPPMEMMIKDGDEIIAVSFDDDTVQLSGAENYSINEASIKPSAAKELPKEHTLLLGWNDRASSIIQELDHYVAQGSTVKAVANLGDTFLEHGKECESLDNISCIFASGDTTNREVLENLSLGKYNHVILLSYSGRMDTQEADAITLVTLLHLRDLSTLEGYNYSIVSEILDIQNQELAEAARPDDFIVSDRLISLILSQISENGNLAAIFEDLFDPSGSEIYLKPVTDYVAIEGGLNFYTLLEAACRKGETAIGYRKKELAYNHDAAYGVVINPVKSKPIKLDADDRLIVLAES